MIATVQKEARQAVKQAEKEAQKAVKQAEKEAQKAVKQAEKEAKKAVKQAEKEAQKAVKQAEKEAKKAAVKTPLQVSDILHFFQTSTRSDNDEANKKREQVLAHVLAPPEGYREDPIYGEQWEQVANELHAYYRHNLCPTYTHVTHEIKAGRTHHYDLHAMFYDSDALIAEHNIEFKNGCRTIDKLPQFLSQPAKHEFMPREKYTDFFYDNYLTEYLSTDTGITAQKPPKEEYNSIVYTTNYDRHPMFAQMYARDETNKQEKNAIVNASIKAYLEKYGQSIDLTVLSALFTSTQPNKHYALWSNGKFHYDTIAETDMSNLQFLSIKNSNTIVVRSPTCEFHLLLRWRNHKGVLMPAWQIAMKRCTPELTQIEQNLTA